MVDILHRVGVKALSACPPAPTLRGGQGVFGAETGVRVRKAWFGGQSPVRSGGLGTTVAHRSCRRRGLASRSRAEAVCPGPRQG